MKILSVEQVREWDKFTIEKAQISSLELMEKAALACTDWLKQRYAGRPFMIICGKGNNGGDGLAIARLLHEAAFDVEVFVADHGKPGTRDFEANQDRLMKLNIEPVSVNEVSPSPEWNKTAVLVDALFGSGLNRRAEGLEEQIINHLNHSRNEIISIDMPSGLFADKSSKGNPVVKATHTLTFQAMKLAFLMAENGDFIGSVHRLNIGLEESFPDCVPGNQFFLDKKLIAKIFKPRQPFSHKGTFGHALLLAGSYGKMGAAVLCARACAHTGSGLVSCRVPRCGNDVIQVAIPEAMCIADTEENHLATQPEEIEKYQAIGIGPGIGKHSGTVDMVRKLLSAAGKPLVIDADALNIISENQDMLSSIPAHSILTPHPKEFERLFGKTADDFERMDLAHRKAVEHKLVIVLKNHHTQINLPDGTIFFNSTGNAGMAKGGSGDVLTGIITSLLAQGYEPQNAGILGIYLHGLAGDVAAEGLGEEAMLASDIINSIGDAYKRIKTESVDF